MPGVNIFQVDDCLLLAHAPEQLPEVGGADAQNQLVSCKKLGSSCESNISVLLTLTEFFSTDKEEGVVVVPFEHEVFGHFRKL